MQPKPDWRKKLHWIFASKTGAWVFSRVAPVADKITFKLSGGKLTAVSIIAGLPSLMMTSTGAKSGQLRTIPLVGIPDGEKFILIASNFGKKNHPAWYYNITAYPDVTITLNNESKPYIARRVDGAERDRCWQKAVEIYPGYDSYKQRSGRNIGVFVLEPQTQ